MDPNAGSYGSLIGAGLGAGIGSVIPGGGTLIGAGLGGTLGGIAGGLFGGRPKAPDISGELANIRALFDQMRAQATSNINYQAGLGRTAAASNLAGRGVYRSGVSENTFNQLERDRLNSIGNANASLAGEQAGMEGGLMRSLLGLNYDAQNRDAQAGAARTGALTGLSSNLLLAMLRKGSGGGPGGGSGGGGYGVDYNPDTSLYYA